MALSIINVTPVSPTSIDSGAYVFYRDLGPRPLCVQCGGEDECPDCGGDKPYFQPVVDGDLIYQQFRLEDLFNSEIENPTYGWKNGGDEFWIEAKIVWSSGQELALDSQDIIAGKEVGYFNGSYQNLILNSQKIKDYMNLNLISGACFWIQLQTYRNEYPNFVSVKRWGLELPSVEGYLEGDLFAVEGEIYQLTDGVWTLTELDGDFIFSITQGGFFEFTMDEYFEWSFELEKVEYQTCRSQTFQFVRCEDTVIIEGHHGESDCGGRYYGGEVRFRDRYRLRASFEFVGTRNDRTLNEDDVLTAFESYERHLLRLTRGIPNSWARRLNSTLLGHTVFIDNNEYENFSDLERNNETGLNWWSQITCEAKRCSKTQGCEEVIFANPVVICEVPDCPEVGEPVSLVGELGQYSAMAVCGSTFEVPAATVEDTEGNILGQVDAGQTIVVDCSGGDPSGECDPAIVENSDESFIESIASGATYILDDYNVKVYLDGVLVDTDTRPAMTNVTVNINWI